MHQPAPDRRLIEQRVAPSLVALILLTAFWLCYTVACLHLWFAGARFKEAVYDAENAFAGAV